MADQLATPADLASLLQQDLDASTANLLLDLATAKVQRAAGGQRILAATSTGAMFDVDGWCWDPWLELAQYPIRSATTVLINGVAVTDFYLRSQKLWRAGGWRGSVSAPAQVTVTYTHGHLAGSQALQLARGFTLALAKAGYGNPGGATSEAIDDYKVTYAEADARMQVTDAMEQALLAEYGTSAYVTSSR